MLNGILKRCIGLYQWLVSPILGPVCRFHPTCSDYAVQALDRYGFLKALGKILVRLSKCQPFHAGGHDPVK